MSLRGVRWPFVLLFLLACGLSMTAFGASPPPAVPIPSPDPATQRDLQSLAQQISAVPNGVYKSSSMTLQGITVDSISYRGNQGYVLLYSSEVYDCSGQKSTTSSTFQATLTAVTVTPHSATSRFELDAFGTFQNNNGSAANAYATIFRGSTNLSGGSPGAFCVNNFNSANALTVPCAMSAIDLPNTTSATTYTVELANSNNSTMVIWGAGVGCAGIRIKEWSY